MQWCWCLTSTHSYDPIWPISPASQLAKMMVRLECQPIAEESNDSLKNEYSVFHLGLKVRQYGYMVGGTAEVSLNERSPIRVPTGHDVALTSVIQSHYWHLSVTTVDLVALIRANYMTIANEDGCYRGLFVRLVPTICNRHGSRCTIPRYNVEYI